MKVRRKIATLLIFSLLSIPLAANTHGAETTNCDGIDFITEMRLAAEDGSEDALRHGALCELDRNLKIREQNLPYGETEFFKPNWSGEEILRDILNYIESSKRVYLGTYRITGYTISYADCGKIDGITASGVRAEVGRTCAAGPGLPFGTRVYIEGIGERIVEDRGGGVGNGHIDVLFETCDECFAATGYYNVYLIGE